MQILFNEIMADHTSFKVGGPVKNYIIIESEEELAEAIQKFPDYYIVGKGSNLIVSDEGYGGSIIEVGRNFGEISLEANANAEHAVIFAQAGASLAAVAAFAKDNALTGFEFAAGIPGTVGGACIMNAGAYDGEMKNVLKSIRLMDKTGKVFEETPEECDLGYRHSNIDERGLIVTGAKIELTSGNRDEIQEKMRDLNQRRRDKQPLEYPSAGSTFKRPEGYFAGKLIQDAGLMGYRVGGMEVSTKHAGFVINAGNGTCEDFIKLTDDVTRIVKEKFGVMLEREVKILK